MEDPCGSLKEGNNGVLEAPSPDQYDASDEEEPSGSRDPKYSKSAPQSKRITSSKSKATSEDSPTPKWPPKVPVNRLSQKATNELYGSLGVIGSRQFFDSKIDQFIATLKKDSPSGQIRRGHVSLFFGAKDFTNVHGALFWGFSDPDAADDDLHLKIAQYIGNRNQLFKNKVNDTNYRKRLQKSKSHSGTPRPAKAPKIVIEMPKRASRKDITTEPPVRPRNEDVDTDDSEGQASQTQENNSTVRFPVQNGEASRPLEELDPSKSYKARELSLLIIAVTDLRIKFKPITNRSAATSRARTKVAFTQLSTYESFFPSIVDILSERYPKAADATSGELVYSWDEENSLEIRKGEVEDWNAFVVDMEERWEALNTPKGQRKGKKATENRQDGAARLKIYFDLIGS